jgi:hypothetical protein
LIQESSLVPRFVKVASAFAVFMVALLVVMVAVPKTASAAEPGPLIVTGNVWDSNGDPVIGASCLIKDLTTGLNYGPILSVYVTDEYAQYEFFIPQDDWTTGDRIKVEVTYGATSGFNEGDAPDHGFPFLQLDVTLSDAIPEFGTTLGASIAACLVGAVAIVAVGKPKKKSPQ